MLGMMALFYLSFTLAFVLAPAVGGLIGSFGLIAAFHALLLGLLVRFRETAHRNAGVAPHRQTVP